MRQTVVSGVAYAVSEIDGHQPSALEEFVGAHALRLSHGEHQASVHGLGMRVGPEAVTFSEKDGDVGGKDAREWKITVRGGTEFRAEHQARF